MQTALVWPRKDFAAMQDEGTERITFNVGSEGLCRNSYCNAEWALGDCSSSVGLQGLCRNAG